MGINSKVHYSILIKLVTISVIILFTVGYVNNSFGQKSNEFKRYSIEYHKGTTDTMLIEQLNRVEIELDLTPLNPSTEDSNLKETQMEFEHFLGLIQFKFIDSLYIKIKNNCELNLTKFIEKLDTLELVSIECTLGSLNYSKAAKKSIIRELHLRLNGGRFDMKLLTPLETSKLFFDFSNNSKLIGKSNAVNEFSFSDEIAKNTEKNIEDLTISREQKRMIFKKFKYIDYIYYGRKAWFSYHRYSEIHYRKLKPVTLHRSR